MASSQSYLIITQNDHLASEDLTLWLVSGYIKTEFEKSANIPADIQKMTKNYFGMLWKEKEIQFDQGKAGNNIGFISSARIIKLEDDFGYPTVITNQIMNKYISKKWRVKYKINSQGRGSDCFIGYALQDGIKEYAQALGIDANEETSTGIQIHSNCDYYSLWDEQHK
eukprot:857222_1